MRQRKTIKLWLSLAGQVGLGAYLGSLVLEMLTRFAVLQFVPRIHDVQFVLLLTMISFLGGIFGGVTAIALLAAKVRKYKLAGSITLIFGALGMALSLANIAGEHEPLDKNEQPFIEALAYTGFVLMWSTLLIAWGISLLLKKSRRGAV